MSFVPLPGVNPLILRSLYEQTRGGILDIFNTFSGGSLERMSLIALGVMPYITASIVVQLAASLHPALMALKKEGESGRKKLNQYTRYGAVLLTVIQGWFVATGLEFVVSRISFDRCVCHLGFSLSVSELKMSAPASAGWRE